MISNCFIKIKYSVYCERWVITPRMYLYSENAKMISSDIWWILIFLYIQFRPFRTNCPSRSEEWLDRKGETNWKAHPQAHLPVLTQISAGSSCGCSFGAPLSLRGLLLLLPSLLSPFSTIMNAHQRYFCSDSSKNSSVIKIKL